MPTREKILLFVIVLILLATAFYAADMIRAEWQQRKERERIEKECWEAWAALCADAGVNPNLDDPEEEPTNLLPGTKPQEDTQQEKELIKPRVYADLRPAKGKPKENKFEL